MAGVMADQGQVRRHDAVPQGPSGGVQHFQVAPENILDLAQILQSVIDAVDGASQGMVYELRLPPDAFLGDPHSKWAVDDFNKYLVKAENSFTNIVLALLAEHKKTFDALKAIADDYGKTDEWNARHLHNGYGSK